MNVRIVDLPGSERPRERLERLGPGSLSDQELLALVLRTGGREANAVTIGQNLLSEWGSLDQMASARYEDLLRQSGLGAAKAAGLLAAFEIGRRSATGGPPPTTIATPGDLARLVAPLLRGSSQEEVVLVVTNSANRVVRTIKLTQGGADRCLLVVRDVIAAVLRNGGTGFAIAHNHPSGDCTPSAEDRSVTRRTEVAASTVGLRFLDHIVIAGNEWARCEADLGAVP